MLSPDCVSHSLMVLSEDPETMREPSGLNATLKTQSECPSSVAMLSPDCVSHSLMVLSEDPETMREPSGLNATLKTQFGVSFQCSDVIAGLCIP